MSLDAKLLLTVYSIPRLSISGSNEQAALYDSEPLLVWIKWLLKFKLMTSSTDIYEQGKMFTTKRLYVTSFRISTTEEWQLLGTVDPNTLHTTTP